MKSVPLSHPAPGPRLSLLHTQRATALHNPKLTTSSCLGHSFSGVWRRIKYLSGKQGCTQLHSAGLVIKHMKIHSREPEPVGPFQGKPRAPRRDSYPAKAPAPFTSLWFGGNDCHLLPWTSADPFLFIVHQRDENPYAGLYRLLLPGMV